MLIPFFIIVFVICNPITSSLNNTETEENVLLFNETTEVENNDETVPDIVIIRVYKYLTIYFDYEDVKTNDDPTWDTLVSTEFNSQRYTMLMCLFAGLLISSLLMVAYYACDKLYKSYNPAPYKLFV